MAVRMPPNGHFLSWGTVGLIAALVLRLKVFSVDRATIIFRKLRLLGTGLDNGAAPYSSPKTKPSRAHRGADKQTALRHIGLFGLLGAFSGRGRDTCG